MSKGSSGTIGYDAFLDHSSSGGGGSFLKSWKEDGQIDVWTHPAAPPAVRWAHSFWQIGEKKEKGGAPVAVVKSYRWICWEKEVILRKQRFRDDDIGARPHGVIGNGRREYPPEVCPMCLLSELLRDQVRAGRLVWTAPLFEWKFQGDESEVVSVGGFCGLFSRPKNDYSTEQTAQMRKAGIEQDEIFMENATARCDYLLRVIDDANPDEGCVIASVADALGRKVQKAFKDRIESSKGAFVPSRDPMCLRWKFDDAQAFEKKYDVVSLIEAKPSEDVLEALKEEPPSVNDLVAAGNVATLRAQMEKHCVLTGIPWDEVFGRAEAEETEGPGDEPWDETKTQGQVPANAPTPAPQQPAKLVSPATPAQPPTAAPAPASGFAEDECEVCSHVMLTPRGDPPPTKCTGCGSEFDSFTGAITFNATLPTGPGNMPKEAPPPAPAAEAPPPAGRPPGRRRKTG